MNFVFISSVSTYHLKQQKILKNNAVKKHFDKVATLIFYLYEQSSKAGPFCTSFLISTLRNILVLVKDRKP